LRRLRRRSYMIPLQVNFGVIRQQRHMTQGKTTTPATFEDYLRATLLFALDAEATGKDNGAMRRHLDRVKRGVEANWAAITPESFLRDYLFCVGSIQKKYQRRMDTSLGPSYWERQLKLFRHGSANSIVLEEHAIRSEWAAAKVDLSPKMVEATLDTARQIVDLTWPRFRAEFLRLPANRRTEDSRDWQPTFEALRELKMVGKALAPYLVRNLYGGSFFKPDVHIVAIAQHYFGDMPDPVTRMAVAAKQAWPSIVPSTAHADLQLGNLGIIDYLLWFYRQAWQVPRVQVPTRVAV
jgi:hypothetical protein